MHFPYFLSSTRRSSHTQCGQLKILIIFLIGGLTIMQHVRNVATSTITTTDNKSTQNLSDESGFSVELPKPLLMLANGKPTANLVEALALSISTSKRLQRAFSQRPTLMDVALQASAREGLHAMTELYGKLVPNIVRNGHLLDDNHPAALLSKFSESTSETLQQEMAAYATISATKAFRKNYKYFNELARQAHTSKISLRHTALEGLCPPRDPPTCMPASARYRTHDGTCNSRRRPRWGASQMPFNRFLPPEYGDGVDSVRMSVDGGPLASSRFVSLLVHGAREGEAPVTLMTAQWGQLLDHDMTSTAQPRSINGSVPSCCGNTDFHPSCFPIKVPLDDPWLAPLKVRCLEFLRSAPAQRRDCILSWREQTNQATSYIDASPIYSNSVKSSDNARVFRNGQLVFGRGNPMEDACQRGALATHCIRAGDGRSGEQPGLLALHHVWVGEHNRIAMELSQMNLHWSDEKIYQEARRIVGAMFQHITYREFLPIVLGREVCKLFDLELLSSGYYEGYDPKTNPTVANSFAAAAFRFGHSLVQNSYMRCDRFHNFLRNNVSLHEEFQRGDIGSPGSLHRLLRGLVNQRALKRDEFITPELTNHLFQTPGFPFGLDLAAINIQRGRDHGVPPYTAWRVPCGLTPINNWEEFANVVGPQSAHRISHAYRSVHDIDLFVGGIAERPVVGGLVGPTFACIIAQQFSNSRRGDRFWYENGGLENSFTPAQLNAIRRISLAQILCRSVGGGTMQPHAFLPTEVEGNERQVCGTDALAPFDLSPWIEHDPFTSTLPTTAAQEPDRVFTIVTTDDKKKPLTVTGTVQVVKENKVGFPNRLHPADNKNSIAAGHSGFVQGIQVPGQIIRIDDKLDIRQKVTPVKRPTGTAKPIKGINNKLDKGPTKLTLNIRGVTVRRPQTTRRTTAVVNNIPLELRTADRTEQKGVRLIVNGTQGDVKLTRNTQSTTTESMTVDKKEARTDDFGLEEKFQANEATKTETFTELLEHKEFDGTVPDEPKESVKTNAEANTMHLRETGSNKSATNNVETPTTDKTIYTKEDDRTLLLRTPNVQAETENLPIRTKSQLSSTKEDSIQKKTNELSGTENADIRNKARSTEGDNGQQIQTTENEEIGTKSVKIPGKSIISTANHKRSNDQMNTNNVRSEDVKSTTHNNTIYQKTATNESNKNDPIYTTEQESNTLNTIQADLVRETQNNEEQGRVKRTRNTESTISNKNKEPNSEQLVTELTTGRHYETLTNKLEVLETNVDEKRVDKELVIEKDDKSTTITNIHNNNLQDSNTDVDSAQLDKEQKIKRKNLDNAGIKEDVALSELNEKTRHNKNKLEVKPNDKDKTDNNSVLADKNISTLTTILSTKQSAPEKNGITEIKMNISGLNQIYFNSVLSQTGQIEQVDDKTENKEASTTFQAIAQAEKNSEHKTGIETEDSTDIKLTYSSSKLNKIGSRLEDEIDNKASSTSLEIQQTRPETDKHNKEVVTAEITYSEIDQTPDIENVDDKIEHKERHASKESSTTFETEQQRTQFVKENEDHAQRDKTRLNETSATRKPEIEIKIDTSTTTFGSQHNTEDINPLTKEQTGDEQKRLKRRRTEDTRKLIVIKGATSNNDTKTRLLTKTTKSAISAKTSTTPTTATPRKTTLKTRTTSRQVELRQYQTRPQKVVVNGPNSDQYEIEINIRQTNQKQSSDQQTVSAATNPYTNYPTTYKPYYGYDRYTTNYVGTYAPNNKATLSAINTLTRRTRPPTIIYVDDPDDRYTIPTTTTRGPGLFQSILTYATTGLGNFNKQQQASPHSTTNIQKERPAYGAGGVPNANGFNQMYSPNSQYIPRPGSQTHAVSGYPAASLSQIDGVVSNGGSNGFVQATSSAISTGNFGSIAGVAQANGADSTFSFNIRPKPGGVGQSQQLPSPISQMNGAGSYGLLPTQQNIFSQLPNPSFGNLANSAASLGGHSSYGNTNKPTLNSPFSSGNKRPQQESYYGYHGQKQSLPLQQKTDLGGFDTGQDYDEFVIARTLEPIETNSSNQSETSRESKENGGHKDVLSESVENENENDYDYADDSMERSETIGRDGYVRPQDVINTVLKSKENELRNLTNNKNCTLKPLDDNYVLPILNTTNMDELKTNYLENTGNTTATINTELTTTTENVTNFPDIMEKHFNNDILAVDYEDELTETVFPTPERMLKTSTNKTQQKTVQTSIDRIESEPTLTGEIAFAPIKILNKLERPDNWLIYDSPENYTRLPELPAMYAEDSSAPTNEIPKPFQGLTSLWLKKIKKDKERNKEQFFATKLISPTEPVSGNMSFT